MKRLRLLISLSTIMLFISCAEKSSEQNSESALIMKINAVQEQIMVQGNISNQEEKALLGLCSIVSHNDGLANYSPDNRMVLKDAEIAPIYEGCENLFKEETKACFKTKISSFFKREFNLSVSKDLNLSQPKQVDVFFIIDHTGNLTGMKVRDSEVTIQGEILRVLRTMPVMKPATHNGKNVSVLCSMVVKYGNDIEIDVIHIPERPDS